ncbi:hypothetical protein EC957_009136 [Mortierella hygrophila]|uniref:Uncharacterized protein n=1 Tax=Mortierella hygrophila TaxID=979708 RepID=A0A9P6JXU8_9FUNG|nr:hypothetical protein EC957_009136 [Mortierella hygrophila]
MSPKHCQRFRHERVVESLAVHKNKATGERYSCLDDIKHTYPDALRFKVDGVVLNFMRDANEHIYEPKRIAHHPEDIIDVICTTSVPVPPTPPSGISDRSISISLDEHPDHVCPGDSIDLSVQTLSIQTGSGTTTRTTSSLSVSPTTNTTFAHSPGYLQSITTAQETTVCSPYITTNLSSLQLQYDGSDDVHSLAHHRNQFAQALHHLHEVRKEQVASRVRELQMIKQQAEAREREEQIIKNQKQMIDRLIITQRQVDAILVQNYELHEYPIPRLFVIMPEPVNKWDPTNLLGRKYRLHFLCECSNHRRPSSNQFVAPLDRDARFKNRVHLTDHKGYELSRPTEFFEQYGAFLLGTLRILKHCLEVATAVAPVAGLVHGGVRAVMKEVNLFADSHLESIDSSIDFLKNTLEEYQVNMGLGQDCDADSQRSDTSSQRSDTSTQWSDAESQLSDHLQTIAALEGADLRRLHTFLRSNDEDKVLGDLYRATTEAGHVKWVCLKHYGEQYRTANMTTFIQSVEAAKGHYDRHFRKVTITLKSTIAAKDFLKRLVSQGSTVNELHVTLAWNFWSPDLAYLVDKISHTNIEVLHLDFDDSEGSPTPWEAIRLSRGKYYPLLDLLSNRKLRAVHFANLSLLGSRTPDLTSAQMGSSLRSFHFFGAIRLEDDYRLARIVSSCQGLVDLRLGSGNHTGNLGQRLHLAICSLKNLQSLHLQCMYRSFDLDKTCPTAIATSRTMKEIVGSTVVFDVRLLEDTVQRSLSMLEVMVLESHNLYKHHFAMVPEPKFGFEGPMPYELPSLGVYSATTVFSRMTHIDLFVRLTNHSLNTLRAALPHLRLIHFGSVHYIDDLLKHVNFVTLKSLSIGITRDTDLKPLQDAFITKSLPCQIDSLKIEYYRQVDFHYPQILHLIPLTRLHLSRVDDEQRLCQLLEAINFSRLEVLSIYECKYSKAAEAILSRRTGEFLGNLTVQLDECSIWHYSQDMAYVGDPRAVRARLPERWVQHLGHIHRDEIHYRFLQPILPVTYY